ncbi:hypothetical protein ATKI12_0155 [Kitasatospora sp. Ki12]
MPGVTVPRHRLARGGRPGPVGAVLTAPAAAGGIRISRGGADR